MGSDADHGIGYIFVSGGGTYTFQDSLVDNPFNSNYDISGFNMSMSGDYVALSSLYGFGTTDKGTVHIYHRSGNQWSDVQTIQSDDNSNVSNPRVSMRGNYLLIGNPDEDYYGNHRGNVYIYQLISGTYVQQRRIWNYTDDSGMMFFPSGMETDGVTIMLGVYPFNNRQGKVMFTTIVD